MFTALGFTPRGRHWELGALFVEVPGRTMDDPAAEYPVGEYTLRLARPEVVLADRVVGFRHWRYTAYGLQALTMMAAFGELMRHGWKRGCAGSMPSRRIGRSRACRRPAGA